MAGPKITDNPAKSHHYPTRCGLNLPHPAALMKLMEGISDMLFLLSPHHCCLFHGVADDVGEKDHTFYFPACFDFRHEHEKMDQYKYGKCIYADGLEFNQLWLCYFNKTASSSTTWQFKVLYIKHKNNVGKYKKTFKFSF